MATIVTTKDTGNSALRIGALIALSVFVALLNLVPIREVDFWLQMKIGGMVWNDSVLPKTVLFTFTPARDNAFNAHEWLPSVLFYFLERWLGMDKLAFVQCALGLTQFGLCAALCKRLSGSFALGILLSAMAMVVANFHYRLRPGLFGIMLLMLLIDLLYRYQSTKRWTTLLWSLPIALIWANTHGSFILGPIVACIFAVGASLDVWTRSTLGAWQRSIPLAVNSALPYIGVAFVMVIASVANPMGWELLRFVFTLSGSHAARLYIVEWMPTLDAAFLTTRVFILFFACLLLCLWVAWMHRQDMSWIDFLLLAAFAVLAFYARRNIELFGFIGAVFCARLLALRRGLDLLEKPALAAAMFLGAIGSALTLTLGNVYGAHFYSPPPMFFTKPMIQALSDSQVRGPIYNSYPLGAELIYRFYPKLQPTIDPRCDSYGDAYLDTFEHSLVDPALLSAFVDAYNIRYMLLLQTDFAVVNAMDGFRKYWRVRFADQKMVLLERVA